MWCVAIAGRKIRPGSGGGRHGRGFLHAPFVKLEDGPVNNHHLAETGSKIAIHTLAVMLGLVLVVTGLGLGVTMVGLPLGLPIGLAGVLVGLWGLFGTVGRS